MKKKVLVIGDAMLDVYVHGRYAGEDGTVQAAREVKTPGGAANVAMNARAQGVPFGLIMLKGCNDPRGDYLQTVMEDNGAWVAADTPLRHKLPVRARYTAAGRQVLRVDDESEPLSEGVLRQSGQRVVDLFQRVIEEVGVLVLVDYGKGALSTHSAPQLVQLAGRAGIPTVVMPCGDWRIKYYGAEVLVPGWAEAADYCQVYLGARRPYWPEGDEAVARGTTELVAQSMLCRHVVLTAGGKGAHWFEVGQLDPTRGTHHRVPAVERRVFDPTGARETLVGVLAAEILRGTDRAEAVVRANAAAGVAVSRPGTAVVSRLEVEEELGWTRRGTAKVVSVPNARDLAEQYKRNGRSVGFLFGEFHQLKPGHVRFMAEARRECDFLVVGVCERHVPKESRGGAYQEFDERLEVVAALADAGVVVPVPDDDVAAVLRDVRPDVLFVSPRYEHGTEATLVADRGGRVVTFQRR